MSFASSGKVCVAESGETKQTSRECKRWAQELRTKVSRLLESVRGSGESLRLPETIKARMLYAQFHTSPPNDFKWPWKGGPRARANFRGCVHETPRATPGYRRLGHMQQVRELHMYTCADFWPQLAALNKVLLPVDLNASSA